MKKILAGAVLGVGGLLLAVRVAYLGIPIFENVDRLPGEAKTVALSFDDGPNPPYTEQILEVLRARDVRATLFMTGQHVARHPETVRRVIEAGHHVGNHSWNAERLALMRPSRVRAYLARTDALLRGLGVTGPLDVRAPGLAIGLPGAWVFRATGRRHVGGTNGAGDWTREPVALTPCPFWMPASYCPTQSPDRLTARVLAGVHPGAVIVLHDGHDAFGGADRSGTVETVRRLIPALRALGYGFAAVQDVLPNR